MKRIAAVLVAVLGLGLALAQTYTLRFNHVLGPNHPYHAGFQTWAERVAQRTGGDLRILVFHSSQLGIEEDIIEQLRQGIPLGQNTDGARLGNYVRELGVFNGPYFVEDYAAVERLASFPWSKAGLSAWPSSTGSAWSASTGSRLPPLHDQQGRAPPRGP